MWHWAIFKSLAGLAETADGLQTVELRTMVGAEYDAERPGSDTGPFLYSAISFMAQVSVMAFQKLNGGVADDASPVAGGIA
jgi:hypothetical protein